MRFGFVVAKVLSKTEMKVAQSTRLEWFGFYDRV